MARTELLMSMHTTSQLPEDLLRIKRCLGFPLVQFESPIALTGFERSHMLGTPALFLDIVSKHYKRVSLAGGPPPDIVLKSHTSSSC